jgi:amino acid permease
MTPELREKTKNRAIKYVSPSRVDTLVGLIITVMIFILLVLPVVAMYELTSIGKADSTIKAVGVLVVFTLLFSAAMSFVTKAKRHELFAASAAYCAVLVVFISNFGNDR